MVPRTQFLTYSGLNLEEYNLAFKTLLEISLTFLIDLLGFYFILLYYTNTRLGKFNSIQKRKYSYNKTHTIKFLIPDNMRF